METNARGAGGGRRILFLDNLRTAMIFLVVLYHAGVVYESSGLLGPYWIVDDPSTNDVAGLVNVVIDIFTMPAIFFVSGFLAPSSSRRRPGWGFVARRFRRLMVPWLVAVLTLMPLYKVIFLHSRHLPQEPWTTYFHFTNGVLSQSWLWFLPVLFAFDVTFWALAKMKVRPPKMSLGAGVVAAFALAVAYSFTLSVLGLTGWTKTILFDFQNERLLVYFLIFLLGALSFERGVFESAPSSKRPYVLVSCVAWIPINAYLLVLLSLLFKPGEYLVSLPVDLLIMWIAFYVSMAALLYLLISTFRFWGNRQGAVGRFLSANAYSVYVIHMVVLGALALPLVNAGIPSLGKYLVLTISTYVVCNVLVYGYREVLRARLMIPWVARA